MSAVVSTSRAVDAVRCLPTARAAVLERLRELGDRVTVQQLAESLHQHRNTVRGHLDELVAARLVVAERSAPHGRGRPALLYSVNHEPEHSEREFTHLTGLFSAAVKQLHPDARLAQRTGQAWAATLVHEKVAETGALEPLTVLDELGFEPAVGPEGRSIHLMRCPLQSLAHEHFDLICPVHEELIKQILLESGVDVASAWFDSGRGVLPCVFHTAGPLPD